MAVWTLAERKAAEVATKVAALDELRRTLGDRARELGGRYLLYGSAAGRFRHVAMRGYGSFDVELSRPSVLAAGVIVGSIGRAIRSFRDAIDPALDPGPNACEPK